MRISIIAVGRLKSGPERELYDRYVERIAGLSRTLALGPVQLVELNESRACQTKARQDAEAREIVTKQPDKSHLILLDEHGKTLTSTQFASALGDLRDSGTSEVCFAVGGADGHGQLARDAARSMLSLGKLTLPHGLARVVLVEQLYRAATIIAGHPYHRN